MLPESEFGPHPLCMRRGAEGQTDQGPRLSERQASSSGTPAGPSTAGCPQRSEGTQAPGSPFFSLGFFGETKKSKSPAAATERHRNLAECVLARSKNKLGIGHFRGQSTNSPRLRLVLRVPRFASQRNCDPTPKTVQPHKRHSPPYLQALLRRSFLSVQSDSCASPSIQSKMSAMYGCADSPSSRRQTSHSTLHCSLLMSARSTTRLDLLPWVCSDIEYTYCALSRCLMASASLACARPIHER